MSQESEAAYLQCLKTAIENIKEGCERGSFEAWILLPSSEFHHDRFIKYFSDLGYKWASQQGCRKLLTWY